MLHQILQLSGEKSVSWRVARYELRRVKSDKISNHVTSPSPSEVSLSVLSFLNMDSRLALTRSYEVSALTPLGRLSSYHFLKQHLSSTDSLRDVHLLSFLWNSHAVRNVLTPFQGRARMLHKECRVFHCGLLRCRLSSARILDKYDKVGFSHSA